MCNDPSCEACTIKEKADEEAKPLAKLIATLITAEVKAGHVSKGFMPLVGIRACAGVMAAICHNEDEHRMLALTRAMNDLVELYNAMAPEDASERAVVLETATVKINAEGEKVETTIH